MSDTQERVRKLVVEHLCLNGSAEEVQLDARLEEDLGGDSLDSVELVMAFEEEFGIAIEDHEGELLKTVGDCVELIERKRAEKA